MGVVGRSSDKWFYLSMDWSAFVAFSNFYHLSQSFILNIAWQTEMWGKELGFSTKHVLRTWNSAFLGNCAYTYIPYLLAAPTYCWPTGRLQTRAFISESETSSTFMVFINQSGYTFASSVSTQCASFSIKSSFRGIFKYQINGYQYTHHALI